MYLLERHAQDEHLRPRHRLDHLEHRVVVVAVVVDHGAHEHRVVVVVVVVARHAHVVVVVAKHPARIEHIDQAVVVVVVGGGVEKDATEQRARMRHCALVWTNQSM